MRRVINAAHDSCLRDADTDATDNGDCDVHGFGNLTEIIKRDCDVTGFW